MFSQIIYNIRQRNVQIKNGLIIIFLTINTIASATDYYISSSGNDANNGRSSLTPWKTIAKVNASFFLPGDNIFFNKGDTWREQLNVPSSGSAGSPIVFTSYGTGGKPIIQKTTQVSSWTQVGSTNVYYATYTNNPWGVYINDVYVQPCHWPTTAGASTPVFEYPSGNSADNTHVTDVSLTGTPSANLIGAQVNIYTNDYTQATGVVSAFNGTSIMTVASLGTTPLTTFRYYLTAPALTGNTYANRTWMMSENTWFYDTDAQKLYVWKTGGGSPGTVEVSDKFSQDILINGKSYITLDGLNTRYSYYGITALATAVNGAGIIVKNCKLEYHDHDALRGQASGGYNIACTFIDNHISYSSIIGLYLIQYGESLIQNDTVIYSGWYPLLPGKPYAMLVTANANDATHATINNNLVSYATYDGIANTSSYNGIITNNKVDHTNILLPDGGGIYVSGCTNYTVSGNKLTGGTGGGIYLDDPTINSTVELNSVTGGLYGIELHKSTNSIVRRNILTGPFTSVWEPGVIMLDNSVTNSIYYNIIDGVNKNGDGIIADATANNLNNVYNNIIMNCKVGLEDHANTSDAYNNVENNIFYNNTTHINTWSGNIVTTDYNLFYGTGNWVCGGETEPTFALWKKASSGDANSINSDPLFTSITDFHLKSGSPAIGAGVGVELTIDYDGNTSKDPPSIGAYEYDSKPPSSIIPVYQSAVVENVSPSILEMTYNQTLANIVPSSSAFSIRVNSLIRTVNAVAVSGTKVQLTLSSSIVHGDVVTISYTKPSSNPLQTPSIGITASISNQPVINNCINGTTTVNQPPVVTISNPSKGNKYENFATLTITATAYDPDGTVIKVEFYSGSEKLIELTSVPYSYTWKDVSSGTYTITATATDNFNATTTSSPIDFVVGSNFKYDADSEIINLYPNPNDGHFSIEFVNPLQNERSEIIIADLAGKRVYSSPVSKEETIRQIDLSCIKSGIYILMIICKEILVTKKFIKN